MPYSGFSNPYGGLSESIAQSTEIVNKALTDYKKQKDEAAGHELIVQDALQNKVITPQQFADYTKAPVARKNAMLGSIVALTNIQQRREEAKRAQEAGQRAERGLNLQQAQYQRGAMEWLETNRQAQEAEQYKRNWKPGMPTQVRTFTGNEVAPEWKGPPYPAPEVQPEGPVKTALQTGPGGGVQYEDAPLTPQTVSNPITDPYGNILAYPFQTGRDSTTIKSPRELAGDTVGKPVVAPFIHPITRKPVPGLGIVSVPGGKGFQVVNLPTNTPVVQVDEQGVPYVLGSKGEKKILNAQEIAALQMIGVNVPGTVPPPEATPGPIKKFFFGPGASPSATPRQTPTPADIGVIGGVDDEGNPTGPSANAAGNPAAAAAGIAGGGTGAVPNVDAIKYLRANPGTAAAFDQKYGQGMSSAILGQ